MDDLRKANGCENSGWRTTCNVGFRPGVVLDPFADAGTTLIVAARLGRDSIGIELNPSYVELIRKKLASL
ncbi:MAG: hypothetical protein HY660_05180 [Armatimonadetes bacterium]|nr:hypothetical protein [Armatimonadota bacterium]